MRTARAEGQGTSLNRCPLAAKVENIDVVKLSRDAQRRLGCAVNEDVFLECPYAFVDRQALMELSQGTNSPLEHLSGKIVSLAFTEVLMGYVDKAAVGDTAEFVICLNEETTNSLIAHNRSITKILWSRVDNEVKKNARPWQDHGTIEELHETFLRNRRPLYEIVLSLPVSQLCHKRYLGNRSPDEVRDGYVELIPIYENFENVPFKTITQSCQTTLHSKNQDVQTFPGHPKNQWTQYEFEIPAEILELWQPEECVEEEELVKESIEENSSKIEEEKEIDEAELQQRENKRKAWEKMNNFLKNRVKEIVDAISFNASINLYINDTDNLCTSENIEISAESYKDYEERVSLIDLKTVGNKYLTSVSWHYELENIIACSYLDQNSNTCSLVTLWSLLSPLRPKLILDCEEKISIISFCPQRRYTNILVGGCLDGKIIIWELDRQILEANLIHQEDISTKPDNYGEPVSKQAKVAVSTEKAQAQTITNMQWLPPWCRLEPDGNFQLNTGNSPREQKAYFATSSIEGTIFFWCLPKSLSVPAMIRSPLFLTISPFYQLIFKEPNDKNSSRISITCFSLPLAKNEESSNMNFRDQSNLERLRKVFIGTSLGEVLCCSWESQTFSVDVTDNEVCKILSRCCIHDGIVRTMIKSPDLDDVFLTVGGRVFAVWKEDFMEEPVFRRRSADCRYGEGCWSGRSGMFALARLDGCIELWDLKKKSNEAVLLQIVSGKITPYVYANPPTIHNRLLAVLDGVSTLRIFNEPCENCKVEDLERIEWFEEFVWRETRRKIDFRRWQTEYLRSHPTALRRKTEREQAEAKRKHEEARERFLKEQEMLAREEAERKLANRRISKSVIWKQKQKKHAETIILRKKGFVPSELEEKRKLLVELEEEREVRSQKIKEELSRASEILENSLMKEIPELVISKGKDERTDEDANSDISIEKTASEYQKDYEQLREELTRRIKERPYVPEFSWGQTMRAGIKRMQNAKERQETQD